MSHRSTILLLAGALSACGAPLEPAPSVADGKAAAAQPDTSQVIERTIVRQLDDGTEQVTTSTITAAEHQAELAAREQHLAAAGRGRGLTPELATLDSGCAGSSLWIFDAKNNTPGIPPFNHEICFKRSSAAPPVCTDLRQYVRFCEVVQQPGSSIPPVCTYWATTTSNAIGSYWAGIDEGRFQRDNGAVDQGFAPYFRQNDAQFTIAQSDYVCFQ